MWRKLKGFGRVAEMRLVYQQSQDFDSYYVICHISFTSSQSVCNIQGAKATSMPLFNASLHQALARMSEIMGAIHLVWITVSPTSCRGWYRFSPLFCRHLTAIR